MKQRRSWLRVAVAAALSAPMVLGLTVPAARAGNVPIDDLGSGSYLGQYQGGLYPGGSNEAPTGHAVGGLERSDQVQPLDTFGDPDAGGRYVFLSIGMSNTTQEFSTFMSQAAGDSRVNHDSLVIADGARGGQAASSWTSPLHANYDQIRDQVLAPKGLTEQQVQAAWVKVANASPTQSLPSPAADAFRLVTQMGDISRALQTRYPNLRLVFFSSRLYAGYATGSLNPEPYAYESGFAVKWLVEAQIDQMATNTSDPMAGDMNYDTVAPWAGWGPYLWADGLNPRSDGLIWERSDLASDGTHPSQSGREKVASLLMDFMLTSPFTQSWFAAPAMIGDADRSGYVDDDDLSLLLTNWGTGIAWGEGDFDGDHAVDDDDLSLLLSHWNEGAAPVDGSAVPEPAVTLFLVIGVAALIHRREGRPPPNTPGS